MSLMLHDSLLIFCFEYKFVLHYNDWSISFMHALSWDTSFYLFKHSSTLFFIDCVSFFVDCFLGLTEILSCDAYELLSWSVFLVSLFPLIIYVCFSLFAIVHVVINLEGSSNSDFQTLHKQTLNILFRVVTHFCSIHRIVMFCLILDSYSVRT